MHSQVSSNPEIPVRMRIFPSYKMDCLHCEKIAETGQKVRYSGLMKEIK